MKKPAPRKSAVATKTVKSKTLAKAGSAKVKAGRPAPKAATKFNAKTTLRAPLKAVAKAGAKAATRKAAPAADVLLTRAQVAAGDTWDLKPLFADDAAWEVAYADASDKMAGYESFKGKLGESAATLLAFFTFDAEFSRLLDRLANYASLRTTEDQGNSAAQRLRGKFGHLSTKVSEATSFFRPELLALPKAKVDAYLADSSLKDWKLAVERIVRYRPHTLSPGEEKLLAMQGQMAEASNLIFTQLNNADLKFGKLQDENGRTVELSHSSFSSFLQSPKREVRKAAFDQFYGVFDSYKNTISASLASSIHRDIYYARARGFATAREAALFPDNVPTSVYDNLVGSVRKALPSVHRYYDIRRRAMKLKDIHHYDTYVPILSEQKRVHTWDQAVNVVCASLSPLGSEYVDTLRAGLTTERWCDRYPNQGKQSGAFSSGVFDSPPYILMNFREDVLEHVFTLTHEAGHSMHTWNSNRNQPYQYSDYVIFVAEVASTFNEELLAQHLMDNASTRKERAYLINRQIDGIRSTIVRQTMFAEFERDAHAIAESGEAVTVDALRATYRKLLDAYFGPGFTIDPTLELECLRIPHFYRAFYVYKYATGLAAAIALSQKVLSGEKGTLHKYLTFLRGGGSKFPLDLLKDAGVDMTTPAPVDAALKRFDELVTELDELL